MTPEYLQKMLKSTIVSSQQQMETIFKTLESKPELVRDPILLGYFERLIKAIDEMEAILDRTNSNNK